MHPVSIRGAGARSNLPLPQGGVDQFQRPDRVLLPSHPPQLVPPQYLPRGPPVFLHPPYVALNVPHRISLLWEGVKVQMPPEPLVPSQLAHGHQRKGGVDPSIIPS